MVRNLQELEARRRTAGAANLAVVCPYDAHTVQAVARAVKSGRMTALMVGDESRIRPLMETHGLGQDAVTVVNAASDSEAVVEAVRRARQGGMDGLVKGKIQTRDFLKAVVDSSSGIKQDDRLLSHLALLEIPGYKKIIGVADGGMVVSPSLEEKRKIVQNSVLVFRSLGYKCPKVAVLAAVELVNSKMKETEDAARLSEMEWSDCVVEGPISYDLAFSRESAEIKGYTGRVTGDVDILLMPDLAAGNTLGKALMWSAGARMAGVVVGATVPIVLTSRGSSPDEKYYSIVLAMLVADTDQIRRATTDEATADRK